MILTQRTEPTLWEMAEKKPKGQAILNQATIKIIKDLKKVN